MGNRRIFELLEKIPSCEKGTKFIFEKHSTSILVPEGKNFPKYHIEDVLVSSFFRELPSKEQITSVNDKALVYQLEGEVHLEYHLKGNDMMTVEKMIEIAIVSLKVELIRKQEI